MSDCVDVAAVELEAHIHAALAARKPTLPFTGRCHYCAATIGEQQHFCDADCRYDYERTKVNGGKR